MDKKKLLKAWKELNRGLGDQSDLSFALEQLKLFIENLPEESSKKNLAGKNSSELTLPPEIQHHYQIALFSDGACRGNPGPGAWGALGQGPGGVLWFESSGIETHTTNNRMELTAAIEALGNLKNVLDEKHLLANQIEVFLYTDSNLVVQGANEWIHDWRLRNWKKADGKNVANVELWQLLDDLTRDFKTVKFIWVKGHSGHPQNERCDELANQALDESGF